ncbi:MAG: septal ring lytic transglycosylase RlpA family protein [Pseudomonadota bacterium]
MLILAAIGIIGLSLITIPSLAARQCGSASWYALDSQTASGERMNPSAMTAAHRKLKFGTKVRVTNQINGKSVIVRINDRGPFTKGRVIDLSRAAAAKLGYLSQGHTPVCIEKVG